MIVKQFHQINKLLGWALFLVAAVVYTLTVEPTASFWDCGEYIAAAYRLQVTHPPGAPLFLLLARMFSFLAGKDRSQVAFWINMSSVLASAGAVMFVFWIISLLARRALGKSIEQLAKPEAGAIWGASLIGSLALIFCGTFWFTATETETYAFSILLMCLAIWAMLQWTKAPATNQALRWLVLVAYFIGLSLGIRLFSVLTIPGLCLIFYFHKTEAITFKGVIQTLIISGVLILTIWGIIIPGLPTTAFQIELFCVNRLGLPFQSGIIAFILLLIGSLLYGIFYSIRKEKVRLHIAIICFSFILLGYGTYGLVLIRAHANPPLNANNPSDPINFINYVTREQYGHRALLYGPHFDAKIIGQKKGKPVYKQTATRYKLVAHKPVLLFAPKDYMFFPRIWSLSPIHADSYRYLLKIPNQKPPTFRDNLIFFFKYQLAYGYFRYFLWNFSGRAHDGQGALWLTPLDSFKKIPEILAQHPARSNFLLLPCLLGLLGIILQYQRDKKYFSIILMLFLMLGPALVVYLNPPPIEPRERDYIYVGSFVVFTVWIGLGAFAVIEYLTHKLRKAALGTLLGILICLPVPGLMAQQGWRSHDRSHRYFSVDSAKNLLASCAPHAILFTGGDNDTFPLWYVQEVEGFRTDVRVIVLSYANAAWYINQMLYPLHEAAPLPLSIQLEKYQQYGLNDFLPYLSREAVQEPWQIQQYLQLISKDHPDLQIRTFTGEYTNTIPVRSLSMPVNKQAVIHQGCVPKEYHQLIPDTLTWKLTGKGLEKKDLLILDLIATNNWERPIYFNYTSLNSVALDLKAHVITEGTAMRLLPIQNDTEEELINTIIMYDNLLHRFYWRNLDNNHVYYDENYRGFITNHRLAFQALAKALIKTGDLEKARATLLFCLKIMSDQAIPFDIANAYMLNLLFKVGETEKALEIIPVMGKRAQAMLAYKTQEKLSLDHETEKQLAILYTITNSLYQAEKVELAQIYQNVFHQYYTLFEAEF